MEGSAVSFAENRDKMAKNRMTEPARVKIGNFGFLRSVVWTIDGVDVESYHFTRAPFDCTQRRTEGVVLAEI